MKQIITFLILPVVAILCACNSRPTSYTLSGNINGFLVSYDNRAVIDSVYVMCGDSIIGQKGPVAPNGTFTLKGTVETPLEAYLVAELTVPGGKGKSSILFVLENGNIVFNDVLKGDIQGTPLNDAVYAETVSLQQMAANSEVKMQRASSFIEKYKHTPATASLLYYIVRQNILSFEECESIIHNADPCIMESNFVNKYVTSVLRELKIRKALDTTKEGAMFVDFEVEYNGKMQRLSDYVGKGQYVLVDFWASWCTPCRMEIPNLVNIYNKYKNKGLVVLGVSFNDKPEQTQEAIKKLEIPYPQIIGGEGKVPAETYGIQSIPHIILFAPDGKILKRGIRGEEIEKVVRENIAGNV
jgi:thiol-disulfide isomerase/thioredoxin